MKRILLIILALSFVLTPYAQKTAQRKKTATTARTVRTQKKTPKKKPVKRRQSKAPTRAEKKAAYSNASIRGLQGQRANIQKKIKEQEKALRRNQADVKKRLQDLMVLNGEIDQRQKNIDGIQQDIHHIDGNIGLLNAQLKTLEQQLQDRKNKYIRSMRYMTRHHSVQDKLMFIFSAKNLTQMYRRLSFIRQYSAYQKAQGEAVKAKQKQVTEKHKQLQVVKGHKNNLLYKGQQEKTALEGKQTEQQQVVQGLQKQQKTIQAVIADQRKKDAAINAQIDRLIAQEVARQKARAAAEAKRKAAAEAARERAAELARKKREAEEAARENARRIAEAKALEDKARAEVKAARDKKARDAADRAAHEASQARIAAERKAAADAKRHKQEVAEAKKKSDEVLYTMSSDDRRISGNFESNRGRLPMPITGGYRIVSHFGQYNVEGLNNVRLDNKGINIQGQAGAQARSIFDGEVSGVFSFGGTVIVMVRHGSYISVYCNLSSVNVHRGQKVTARQPLGRIGQDNILQFQLRKETAKLNPEAWLGR